MPGHGGGGPLCKVAHDIETTPGTSDLRRGESLRSSMISSPTVTLAILYMLEVSLSPAHALEGGVLKNWWTTFKTTTPKSSGTEPGAHSLGRLSPHQLHLSP